MSKSYKDQFKEESVRRRQRQQKQIAAVIILIGVLVSAAIWYLDGLSKEQQVPQQTSQQQSAQTAEQPGQEVKPETPAAEPPKEEQKQPEAVKPAYTILIDKSDYKLYVLKDNEVIKQWGVAVGAKPGQKQRAGDMTTPTGNFEVDEILDASYWTHDFMVHMRRNPLVRWFLKVVCGCVTASCWSFCPMSRSVLKLRYGNKLPDSLGTLIFTLSQLDKKVILR